MSKRKGKAQSAPAKNAKYADRKNTKKTATKKGERPRPSPDPGNNSSCAVRWRRGRRTLASCLGSGPTSCSIGQALALGAFERDLGALLVIDAVRDAVPSTCGRTRAR